MSAKATNDAAKRKQSEFKEKQARIRNGLALATMIGDEGQIAVKDLAELYHLLPRKAEASAVWLLNEGLAEVTGTTPDGREIFSLTRYGRRMTFLFWAGRHGLATRRYLVQRFGISSKEAYKFIVWALKQKLVRMGGTLRAEPELVIATATGLSRTGLRYLSVARVSHRVEGHLRAVVLHAIKLELERRYDYRCLSEREIFALNRGRPDHSDKDDPREAEREEGIANPVIEENEETGKKERKRSDLLLMPRRGTGLKPVAIEVELSKKSKKVLVKYLRAWIRCTTVERVDYYTNKAVIPELLAALKIIGDDAAAEKINIIPLDDEDVPSERRKDYYKPVAIPPSEAYYRALSDRAKDYLRPDLLEKVEWIGWLGYVSMGAIAKAFALSEVDACQQLVLAHGAGWLEYSAMLRDEEAMFRISESGRQELRDLGIEVWPARPIISYSVVVRDVACAQAAAELQQMYPNHIAKTREELRRDQPINGEPIFRLEPLGSGIGDRMRPDLMLMPRGEWEGPTIAVMIERHLMQADKVERVFAALDKHDEVDAAIYYALLPQMVSVARGARKRLKPTKKISIRSLPLSRVAKERAKYTREPGGWKKRQSDGQKASAECIGRSHEPRALPDGVQFTGVTDETFAAITSQYPDMACENLTGKKVCYRSVIDAFLYTASNGLSLSKVPSELGYGSGTGCARRVFDLRGEGRWTPICKILRDSKHEPPRNINWDKAMSASRRGRPVGSKNRAGKKTRSVRVRWLGDLNEPISHIRARLFSQSGQSES